MSLSYELLRLVTINTILCFIAEKSITYLFVLNFLWNIISHKIVIRQETLSRFQKLQRFFKDQNELESFFLSR